MFNIYLKSNSTVSRLKLILIKALLNWTVNLSKIYLFFPNWMGQYLCACKKCAHFSFGPFKSVHTFSQVYLGVCTVFSRSFKESALYFFCLCGRVRECTYFRCSSSMVHCFFLFVHAFQPSCGCSPGQCCPKIPGPGSEFRVLAGGGWGAVTLVSNKRVH